jgi:hypothetical protein
MKQIILTKGFVAVIDDEDLDLISKVMTIKQIVMHQLHKRESTVDEVWYCLRVYFPNITRHTVFKILGLLKKHGDIDKRLGRASRLGKQFINTTLLRTLYFPVSNHLNKGTTNESATPKDS